LTSVGEVKATRAADGGDIEIKGGFVALGGTVSADGAKGGTIKVGSVGMLSLADQVTAKGLQTSGGSITYHSLGQTIENSGSITDTSGVTQGGSVSLEGSQGVMSSGTYVASSALGAGGRIDISGYGVRLLSANLDASGASQGGLIRIGGAFQGGKELGIQGDDGSLRGYYLTRWGAAPFISNALRTLVNESSVLNISSKDGIGGTAVIWSNEQTTFLSRLNAGGKTQGGFAEISSAGELRRADLSRIIGVKHVLLDPKNIVVGGEADFGNWSYSAIIGAGYVGSRDIDLNQAPSDINLSLALSAGDNFGSGVSMSADQRLLVIGAPGDDGADGSISDAGSVHLFSFSKSGFIGGSLQGTIGAGYVGGKNLSVAGLDAGDNFGKSLSISADGRILAVGTPGDDGYQNALSGAGSARIITFSDTSFSGATVECHIGYGYAFAINQSWGSPLGADDAFGWSVALNSAGTALAVGAPFDDGYFGIEPANTGCVRLFVLPSQSQGQGILAGTIGHYMNAAGNYADIGIVTNGPGILAAGDFFGWSVSLNGSGDGLAVGAPGAYGSNFYPGNEDSGVVRLFKFTDNQFHGGVMNTAIGLEQYAWYDGWQVLSYSHPNLEAGDFFGSAVSLNAAGDRLAVGSKYDDGQGNIAQNSGAIRLISFSDASFSAPVHHGTIGVGYVGSKDVNLSGIIRSGDHLGASVIISSDASRMLLGAPESSGAIESLSARTGAVHGVSFTGELYVGGTQRFAAGSGYGDLFPRIGLAGSVSESLWSVALSGDGSRMALGFRTLEQVKLIEFQGGSFGSARLLSTIGRNAAGSGNLDLTAILGAQHPDGAFGGSVSLDYTGTRLAVGGDDNGAKHVRLFTHEAGAPVLRLTIGPGLTGASSFNVSPVVGEFEQFGDFLSLNGDGRLLAVGGPDGRKVHLMTFTDNNFGGPALVGSIGSGQSYGSSIGMTAGYTVSSVSLSGDGRLLATGNGDGVVHVFSFSGTNFSGGYLMSAIGNLSSMSVSPFDCNITDELNYLWEMGFGITVALSPGGDRLAVGSYFDNSGAVANYSPPVRVFKVNSQTSAWEIESRIGLGGAGPYTHDFSMAVLVSSEDYFGRSLSFGFDGRALAIAAPGDDGPGDAYANSGAVWIMDLGTPGGGLLRPFASVSYPSAGSARQSLESNDGLGFSVALNGAGTLLAVGSPYDYGYNNIWVGGSSGSGAVRLFTFTNNGFEGGVLKGTIGRGYVGGSNIDLGSTLEDDGFGWSVSLNQAGDRMAVGAVGDSGVGNIASKSGNVRLFSFTDNTFSGGDLVSVIGRGYSGGKNIDLGSSLEVGDNFGSAVALSDDGSLLAVGARHDDGYLNSSANSGNVRLFSFSDTSFSAGQLQAVIGTGYTGGKNLNVSGSTLGWAVAFNGSGTALAIGSALEKSADSVIATAGNVRLFTFSDRAFSGATHVVTIGRGYSGPRDLNLGSSIDGNDWFGNAVALSSDGRILAVGARYDSGFGNVAGLSGSVRLFDFTDGAFAGGVLRATIGRGYVGAKDLNLGTLLEPNDNFGTSVALSDNATALAVGAWRDSGFSNGTVYSGAAHLLVYDSLAISLAQVDQPSYEGAQIGVRSSELASMLSSGASVTLQANNDITIASDIDAGSGSTGSLMLFAGRNVLFDADVRLGSRDLSVTANASVADGVIGSLRDPGLGGFLMSSGVSVVSGDFAVLVRGVDTAPSNPNSSPGGVRLGSVTSNTLAVGIVGSGLTGRSITQNAGSSIVVAGDVVLGNQAGDISLAESGNGAWRGTTTLSSSGATSLRVGSALNLGGLSASGFTVVSSGPMRVGGVTSLGSFGSGLLQAPGIDVAGSVSVGMSSTLNAVSSLEMRLTGASASISTGASLRLWSTNLAIDTTNRVGYNYKLYGATYGVSNVTSTGIGWIYSLSSPYALSAPSSMSSSAGMSLQMANYYRPVTPAFLGAYPTVSPAAPRSFESFFNSGELILPILSAPYQWDGVQDEESSSWLLDTKRDSASTTPAPTRR